MGLAHLTRQSVEQAIAEFDRLGRDAFLERYGFGRANSYFLEQNGNRYDSKAIAGAAYGFRGAEVAPLGPDDFSGGNQTVVRVLSRLGFKVVKIRPQNPTWTQDELILALEFYLTHKDRLPDQASKAISTLSRDINRLGELLGKSGGETFRNANGVYMKLMNFRRLDPGYTASGKVGLSRGAKGEEVVWAEFAADSEHLRRAAAAIRAAMNQELPDGSRLAAKDSWEPGFTEAPEGRLLTCMHRRRERSRKLVEAKKKAFIAAHGRLFCEACAFDYQQHYGERGIGFIECHHIRPIHTLREGAKTELLDLRLLCANCHRMVHSRAPWLTIDQLIAFLRQSQPLDLQTIPPQRCEGVGATSQHS